MATACPDDVSLHDFARGKLSTPDAGAVETHIDSCSHCLARLSALPAGDSIERAVRQAAAADAGDDTLARGLIDRLRALPAASVITPPGPPATCAQFGPGLPPRADTAFLAPPERPGEVGRFGRYRVLGALGRGGMGVVYRAADPVLRREVALKLILPGQDEGEARARFLREARAAAALRSDHVVEVYEVGEQAGRPFLAMELLRGETLEDRLKRDGKLPWPEALTLARQLAEGLAAAHAAGLVHRDVKPANVWLEPLAGDAVGWSKARAKLLDFGLAHDAGSADGLKTLAGTMLGTPGYMAPEQAQGEGIDGRADLFSLGCILYRMLAGESPYAAKSVPATLMKTSQGDCRPVAELVPKLPPAVAELVGRLMAKEPCGRPAAAGDVVAVLRRMEKGTRAKTAGLIDTSSKTEPRSSGSRAFPHLWIATIAVGAVLMAVAGVIVIRLRTPDGKETVVNVPPGSKVDVNSPHDVTITIPSGGEPAPSARPQLPNGRSQRQVATVNTLRLRNIGTGGYLDHVHGITPGMESDKVKSLENQCLWEPVKVATGNIDGMRLKNTRTGLWLDINGETNEVLMDAKAHGRGTVWIVEDRAEKKALKNLHSGLYLGGRANGSLTMVGKPAGDDDLWELK